MLRGRLLCGIRGRRMQWAWWAVPVQGASAIAVLLQRAPLVEDFKMVSSRVGAAGGIALAQGLSTGAATPLTAASARAFGGSRPYPIGKIRHMQAGNSKAYFRTTVPVLCQ